MKKIDLLPKISETEKEYAKRMREVYRKVEWANSAAKMLEGEMAEIREKGYKVIVLGTKVKITLA